MATKIDAKIEIKETAYSDMGELKNAPTEIDGWYGDKICKKISIDSLLEDVALPDGEYEITVVIEKKG